MITKQQADDALQLLRDYKAQIIKAHEERVSKELKELDELTEPLLITPHTEIKDLTEYIRNEVYNARVYNCIMANMYRYLKWWKSIGGSRKEPIVADLVAPGLRGWRQINYCGEKTVSEIVEIVNKAGLEMPECGSAGWMEYKKYCRNREARSLEAWKSNI